MDAAAGRVGRIASHLQGESPSQEGVDNAPTSADAFHSQCYNYEPGRLLMNQVAIITGAGQGLGKAAAILFAQHGAKVVAADLEGDKAQATADFIRNSNGVAIAYAGDVTHPDFPAGVVAAAVGAFGGLHILVNNAGFTWDGVIHRMGAKQWQAMLDVHCTAPFRLIQAAAPHMRDAAKREIEASGKARPRCIINVSSVSGTHGSAGQANYSTAKAGVVGLTKTVAREWGTFNIRCNALAFGHINTRLVQAKERGDSILVDGERVPLGIPGAVMKGARVEDMVALGRKGSPEEAAGSMLLLASPYASYITGQSLEVTGGGWL
ncbi:hypothetical protein ACKKBG_A26480 [Auxenochlorella protothecoides x Auxenochlorella symbiontica]